MTSDDKKHSKAKDTSHRRLDQINDHCLLNIFGRLDRIDLANVALVNERFNQIANMEFKSRCKDPENLIIDNIPKLTDIMKFLQAFGQFIPILAITGRNNDIGALLKMCSDHCEVIGALIITTDDNILLSFTPAIKIPSLTVFRLDLGDGVFLSANICKRVLQQNPQLRKITIMAKIATHVITSISKYCPNVEKLHLRYCCYKGRPVNSADEWGKLKNLKSLQLITFHGGFPLVAIMNSLADNNVALETIGIGIIDLNAGVIETLCRLEKIRKINIHYGLYDFSQDVRSILTERDLRLLTRSLANISDIELHFCFLHGSHDISTVLSGMTRSIAISISISTYVAVMSQADFDEVNELLESKGIAITMQAHKIMNVSS